VTDIFDVRYLCKIHASHISQCVLSFNMGWRILVFYPELEARDKIY
jgi:hypothetical protein